MALDLVFCGTYTDLGRFAGRTLAPGELVMGLPSTTGSEGIYTFRYDPARGSLTEVRAFPSENPSFLAMDSAERFLFAVNEVYEFGGERSGAVSAYSIERDTGALRLINQVATGGSDPCHLSVSPDDRHLLVANWESGSIAVFAIGDDGRLSDRIELHKNPAIEGRRQPRAHFITATAAGDFVLSTDTGSDRLHIYRRDAQTGRLTPHDPPFADTPRGGTPRHLSIAADGHHVFANGESDLTLSIFRFDPAGGRLDFVRSVPTAPEGSVRQENSTAQVIAHPNGRFVYVSNRGLDTIAVIRLDGDADGASFVGMEPTRGTCPRNFQLDPTANFLFVANQNSASLERFSIDPSTGALRHAGRLASVPAPTCLLFTRS